MTVPTRTPDTVATDTATRRRRSRRLADNYLIAADAPATVRAYTADWTHFSRWCRARGLKPMPASPLLVGEYLADLGEGYPNPAVGPRPATHHSRTRNRCRDQPRRAWLRSRGGRLGRHHSSRPRGLGDAASGQPLVGPQLARPTYGTLVRLHCPRRWRGHLRGWRHRLR